MIKKGSQIPHGCTESGYMTNHLLVIEYTPPFGRRGGERTTDRSLFCNRPQGERSEPLVYLPAKGWQFTTLLHLTVVY